MKRENKIESIVSNLDKCSNVIFDASICYHESGLGQGRVVKNHVV